VQEKISSTMIGTTILRRSRDAEHDPARCRSMRDLLLEAPADAG
jgi:hypothetical protein